MPLLCPEDSRLYSFDCTECDVLSFLIFCLHHSDFPSYKIMRVLHICFCFLFFPVYVCVNVFTEGTER